MSKRNLIMQGFKDVIVFFARSKSNVILYFVFLQKNKVLFYTQWSKNQIIFQGGAGPKFDKFPSETYLVMAKYQKLAKSVEGN